MYPARRATRHSAGLRALALSALLGGCSDGDVELPPAPPRGGPEPVLPAPAPSTPSTVPSWVERLPPPSSAAAVSVKAGDRVWAALPVGSSEMVDVAIYTVEGIHDGLISVTSRTAVRVDGVHPALVHRVGTLPSLVTGGMVLFYTASTPAFIGRVADVVGGESIKVRYDHAGTTKTTAADHVEQPVTGVRPLAYVGFPKAGATSRGLVTALTDEHVWLRTASGHVEVHDRERVEALPLPPTAVAVGAAVRAYRWATGYEPGVVTEVLEAGLRYKVRRDPRREGTYFFSSLLPTK